MARTIAARWGALKHTLGRALHKIWRQRALREAVILVAIVLALFLVTDWAFVFDTVVDFARNNRANADWGIDDIIVVTFMSTFLIVIYAVRRVWDLKLEVNSRKNAEQKAHALARHDPLTGLPNRRYFSERLDEVLRSAALDGRRAAVLILDLDGFKPVNDIYGHAAGDLTLIEFATRVSAGLQSGALLARLGGDEFAITLPDIESDEDCALAARRVLSALAEPFAIASTLVSIGVSIGIAVASDQGSDVGDLLRRADLALYRAKAEGRSTIRFFEAQMDAQMKKRLDLERELRRALVAKEIVPYYQPLVSLDGYRLVGFEALARWHNQSLGSISPSEFIPIAEECGLMSELGDRILRQACQEAVQWPENLKVAINVSAIQLRDEAFGLRLMRVLEETGLPTRRLELEIAETVVLENFERARQFVDDVQAAGIRVSLDDFGTGYASIGKLRALHLEKIKIDRSFVAGLTDNHQSQLVTKAILSLVRGFGLSAVAEGIETSEQLAHLIQNGCLQGQGYLFGEPVPAAELNGVLASFSHTLAIRPLPPSRQLSHS